MALDGTFTGLVASVQDFLKRADLATAVPDFIALAEAQMNRLLHTHEMEFVATISISAETAPLPCDVRAINSFRLNVNTEGGKLTYKTPQAMDALPVGTVGCPQFYTIAGNRFVFWPIPDAVIMAKIRGRKALDALSTTNPSNWLLSKHPDAYLYGALVQSAPYLKADDRLDVWGGLFTKALADIEADNFRLVGDSLQTNSGISDRSTWGLDRLRGY